MANSDTQPAQAVNYNITELIESVTEAYLHPPANTSDKNGRMCLYLLADRFSITPIKARKLLITSGAYKTPMSEYIGKLFRSGKTVKEIQNLTGLCAASVSGYLPYRKTVYNLDNTTKYVEHLRRCSTYFVVLSRLYTVFRYGRYPLTDAAQSPVRFCISFTVLPLLNSLPMYSLIGVLYAPEVMSSLRALIGVMENLSARR